MEVSVTKLPWMNNIRIKKFENLEDVRNAVLASSCIVPLAGFPMHVPGVGWLMDGGFSDLQILKVRLDNQTKQN